MTIDAADWVTLNSLLAQVLDLPSGERASWLDALGSEHARLRPTLQALLARADAPETDQFLRTLPKLDRNDASPLGGHGIGQQVGPYKLLRVLGRGGMGTVWLAERADGALKRQVALK